MGWLDVITENARGKKESRYRAEDRFETQKKDRADRRERFGNKIVGLGQDYLAEKTRKDERGEDLEENARRYSLGLTKDAQDEQTRIRERGEDIDENTRRWDEEFTFKGETEEARVAELERELMLREGYGLDFDPFVKWPPELKGGTLHLAWQQCQDLNNYRNSSLAAGKDGDADSDFMKAFWAQTGQLASAYYSKRGEFEIALDNPENREALIASFKDIIAKTPELNADPERALDMFMRRLSGEIEPPVDPVNPEGSSGGSSRGDKDPNLLQSVLGKAGELGDAVVDNVKDMFNGDAEPLPLDEFGEFNKDMPYDPLFPLSPGEQGEAINDFNEFGDQPVDTSAGVYQGVKSFFDSYEPRMLEGGKKREEKAIMELLPILQTINLSPGQEAEIFSALEAIQTDNTSKPELVSLRKLLEGLR